MCVYSMISDWAHKYAPDPATRVTPITGPHYPYPIPAPWAGVVISPPIQPAPWPTTWTREQLDAFQDILARVKAMEDKLEVCPCEQPEKQDFLKEIKARLDALDQLDRFIPPGA